jgi:hypothetical protein
MLTPSADPETNLTDELKQDDAEEGDKVTAL